jgi:hypothetical protein
MRLSRVLNPFGFLVLYVSHEARYGFVMNESRENLFRLLNWAWSLRELDNMESLFWGR